MFEAIFTTVMCMPMILLYRQRPKTYPSKSAELNAMGTEDITVEKKSMKHDLKLLMKNKNFLLIILIYGIQNGIYSAFGTIINYILDPFGYTSLDTSILGVGFILFGVTGSIIFPVLIDKYNWFVGSLKIVTVGSCLAGASFFFTLPGQNMYITMVSFTTIGFFIIPVMAITFSLALEVTYPCSEALFGAVM